MIRFNRLRHKAILVAITAVTLSVFTASLAKAADLPPVPDAIKAKGVLRVGTKCDYPPDGYLDEKGKPQGIEVSLAMQIGEYIFGDKSKTEIVCVTTANRVPALIGGKIDLIIATMGINKKRAEVVDFTDPYAWGVSSVMVRQDSDIKKLDDLKGRKVVFVKGAWQIPWFNKNMPEAKQMNLDTVSDSLQALLQKRAEAYAHDYAVQLGIDRANDKVRIVDEFYKAGFRGAAVRKGEKAWRDYVTAAIKKAHTDGLVDQWIKKYDKPEFHEVRMKLWDLSKLPKNVR